jgi:hypothetical protein
MDEHIGSVLQSAIAYALKLEWCLQGLVAKSSGSSVKGLAVLMKSTQEEHGVVIARHSKPRQHIHHLLMEVLAVLLLEAL